ncbi:hypothetical protein [Lysobacter xanthus]
MHLHPLAAALLACSLAACATTDGTAADGAPRPASDTVTGSAAASRAGAKAIGAYGATGTSDDLRGRSSSSGASVLTGRAGMAGTDSGTDDDAKKDDPPR